MAFRVRFLIGVVLALSAVSCNGGGGGGDGGGGSGGGVQCGATVCAAGEICRYDGWTCDVNPRCEQKPAGCNPNITPVCACDGVVYDDQCAASNAGVDLAGRDNVTCDVPAGTFRCGYRFCKSGEEWCEEQYEGGYACHAFPDECKNGNGTCDCVGFGTGDGSVQGVPFCTACAQKNGGLHIECGSF